MHLNSYQKLKLSNSNSMSKLIPKSQPNKYKSIIINRLACNQQSTIKKNNSHIHSLKTQCTPNDKTQDICQKIFQDFSNLYQIKYQPVTLNQKSKPVNRCLYPEIINLVKRQNQGGQSISKSKSKHQKIKVSQFHIPKPTNNNKTNNNLKKTNTKHSINSSSKSKLDHNKKNISHHNSILKRQNSMQIMKTQKDSLLKKSISKKELKDTKIIRSQTVITENSKTYSVNDLKKYFEKPSIKKI